MSWERLGKAYARRGLVLVVGAGVSVGRRPPSTEPPSPESLPARLLPDWEELLQRLFTDYLKDDTSVDDLQEHGLSLPAIASLIEERMVYRSTFVECIRAALYRDFLFYPGGVNKSNRRSFVDYIQEWNPTLQAVAALCAMRSPDKHTYIPNPHIHAVVTFNLDALLQAYVYARYEKRLLRTVERPSASSTPGKISIYHMHGFLRFDSAKGDPTKEASDAAVLTEQDYFDFFNQPTSLFNYTFLYLLREFPCWFIGLSMQDENIRRLLHYSKLEQYEALRREGVTNKAAVDRKLTRHFVVQRRCQSTIDRAIEQTLRPLGVTVLWVDDFADLPAQMGTVYKSAGDDWDAVF